MIPIRLAIFAMLCLGVNATLAHAQTAIVRTTLTDPGTNQQITAALPGQVVRVDTVVSWSPGQGTQMAGLKGDMLSIRQFGGGVGTVSNRRSDYLPGGLVNLGTVVGDDIVGIDIAVTPFFFTGGIIIPPSSNWQGILIVGYDWTVPGGAAFYEFKFQADLIAPNFRVYPTPFSPAFIEVPTTYLSATLAVVPAPAAGLILLPWAAACARRRTP